MIVHVSHRRTIPLLSSLSFFFFFSFFSSCFLLVFYLVRFCLFRWFLVAIPRLLLVDSSLISPWSLVDLFVDLSLRRSLVLFCSNNWHRNAWHKTSKCFVSISLSRSDEQRIYRRPNDDSTRLRVFYRNVVHSCVSSRNCFRNLQLNDQCQNNFSSV